ncbi:MAG: helix-turn-helix domain-containing protein [candidate division WOR-3 bacterium]|nr:helix-turn-helix domain-containing protein [candidate division WOR-3 bacterium]
MAISIDRIDSNKFYNVEEVSKILNVSTQTVRRHLREESLTGKKIGRRWHIKGLEIKKFIEK